MDSIEFFQVFIIIIILIMTLFYIYFRSLTSTSSSAAAAADTDIPHLQEKYDVFISFRGEDTRDTFTSHLHAALRRKNIETYIDNRLEKGDDIRPTLVEAIEKSKIALVIFSKDYASSTWCLKELVHILGCKKSHGQIVIPIFYRIDPSDVRKQQGTYALKKRFKGSRDEVANWKAALEEAANIYGFHDSSKTRTEADFVEKVVQDVLTKLNHESSNDLRGLVGIESKIEKIESLLCLDSPGVCCMGIWGMGGIGKTTLVEAVFHRHSSKFEAYCFLANVREKSEQTGGLNQLLNELVREILKDKDINIGTLSIGPTSIRDRLMRTKALIVLDDVNASNQLEVLVGDHDRFHDGSRIIITARDKGVLEQKVDNDKIYKVEGLRSDEALQLFHSHALRNKSPTKDYNKFSRKVIDYSKGIPLALKVMGSLFLGCKRKQEWKDQMNKLKRFPSEEINKVLRVSYDGLEENEKEIFLDIACFHKGNNSNYVKVLLDSHGFCGEIGIKVLIDRSLISISKRKSIEMHDLVQEMGRAIAREQCIEEPGKRSRLFSAKDVYQVLTNNQIAATVRAISFNCSKIEKRNLNHANFEKMCQLRWLHVWHSKFSKKFTLMVSLDLPNSLSYLHWHKYPSKSLPSKFSPVNLVELHLPSSQVGAQLWTKDQTPLNLKWISLRECEHLTEVPDLSQSVKIKHIDLFGCERLVEIPSYFQHLGNLTYLNLGGCKNLKNLPEMPCSLEFLNLSRTSIEELPSSVWSHKKISHLDIRYCEHLTSLPSNTCKLKLSSLSLVSLQLH
ncbi:PREDICTED: TMV resistance protein N-like [Prunus mume]|uniref:TMV resistance protein N-like n=1 Tax=Prunus mume TaxID=102107 RepID=A0ABM1LTU2_PRUMU|nr:PREDICTED: TMV resistance protein N-like [Prunus mume]